MKSRGTIVILLAVFTLGWPFAHSVQAQGQAPGQDEFDTSYIAADAFFTMVLRPMNLIKYVRHDVKSRDEMLDMMQNESQMNFRVMDEFIVHFGSDVDKADDKPFFMRDDHVAMVVRFTEPVDQARFVEQFNGSTEATHDGMKYYQAGNEHMPSVYFPNDRSFVLGKDVRLKKLMTEKHSMGTMVHRLRKAGRDYDVLMVAELNTARALITDMVRMMSSEMGLEGEGAPFKPQDYVDKVMSITFLAKLSEDVPMTLDVVMKDEKSAEEFRSTLNGLLILGKTFWPAAKKEITQNAPKPEIGKMAVDTIEGLLSGTKIEAKGKHVEVRVERKGGLGDMVELMSMFTLLGSRSVEAPAVEVKELRDVDGPADPEPKPATEKPKEVRPEPKRR